MKPYVFMLLILLASGTTALAQTPAATKQEAAIAAILKLGGTVERDEQRPGQPVVKVDLHQTQISDADLVHVAGLTELKHLDLRLTKIGDAGVMHLRQLTKLQFLNLFRTQTSDEGLKQLKKLTQLETLLIGGTRVSDAGTALLKAYPRLKKLSLFDTQVGDAALIAGVRAQQFGRLFPAL